MELLKNLVLVLCLVLLIAFAPIITIGALNTLFDLGIEVNLLTWLSIAWLQMVTFGGLAASNRKA
jgi:hypothetical protein